MGGTVGLWLPTTNSDPAWSGTRNSGRRTTSPTDPICQSPLPHTHTRIISINIRINQKIYKKEEEEEEGEEIVYIYNMRIMHSKKERNQGMLCVEKKETTYREERRDETSC